MSERMTDERLEEIDHRYELGRAFISSTANGLIDELLQALKAEKAENERLKGQIESWEQDTDIHDAIARAEAAEARLRAAEAMLTDHVADLRRTANVLAEWQDPMVGPFDATIAELRKAADELDALLKKDGAL